MYVWGRDIFMGLNSRVNVRPASAPDVDVCIHLVAI